MLLSFIDYRVHKQNSMVLPFITIYEHFVLDEGTKCKGQ